MQGSASIRAAMRSSLLIAGMVLPGCHPGPREVAPPELNAAAAASAAISQYGKDGDGTLNASELSGSPALTEAFERIDADHDQSITGAEFTQRLESWKQGSTLIPLTCSVTLRGKPLAGARVRLVPEEFLAKGLPAGEGITDETGVAAISMPDEARPFPDAPAGMYPGFYRVEISKQEGGREVVPDAYTGAKSSLGLELGYDSPAMQGAPRFQLK